MHRRYGIIMHIDNSLLSFIGEKNDLRLKESSIRFHKISINRPPNSALNSMGKRDRKSWFSTHGETHH